MIAQKQTAKDILQEAVKQLTPRPESHTLQKLTLPDSENFLPSNEKLLRSKLPHTQPLPQ